MKRFHSSITAASRTVVMTEAERARLRAALTAHIRENPAAAGPFSVPRLMSSLHIRLRSGIALALGIVLVGTGATAYAAEDALPGDTLYGVKVSIAEPLEGALALTPAAKASWHAKVAETRLAEAQALVEHDRLTATSSSALAANFDEHAAQVAMLTERLNDSDPAGAAAVSARFSAAIASHGAAILQAGASADEGNRHTGALLVRTLVASQTRELALMDHAPEARTMKALKAPAPAVPVPAAAPQARIAAESTSVAATGDTSSSADMTGTPVVMKSFAQPIATATSFAVSAKQSAGTAPAPEASNVPEEETALPPSDEDLGRAIASAARALENAGPQLDAGSRDSFSAKLADLSLLPLAVAADTAAGNLEAAQNDRAKGVRAAGELTALIERTAAEGASTDGPESEASSSPARIPWHGGGWR